MVQGVISALNIASDSVVYNGSSPINASRFCPEISAGESCVTVRMLVLSTSGLTPFDIQTAAILKNPTFVTTASSTGGAGQFLVQPAFGIPTIIVNDLTVNNSQTGFSAWTQKTYPQNAWVPLSSPCVSGVACSNIPVAPSMRYEHSAIMYQTWTLSDVLGHQSFCSIGTNNSMCTESCLVDVTCLRPSTLPSSSPWTFQTFLAQTVDGIFWSTCSDFTGDDSSTNLAYPTTTLSSSCPGACCGNRRKCMRTHDNLGKIVPFNQSFLLVFGGRTRKREFVTDPSTNEQKDLYLECESILENLASADPSYAQVSGCSEIQSDELWRYDTVANTWELIKPNTDEVLPPSGGSTADLYPYGRYGHAATYVDFNSQGYRRKYMFIFGGVSNKCVNGLCADLWRYDIPWAAEAFWPINGASTLAAYNRGNRWKKMSSCPFGGRFRHSMVASDAGDVLFSYGGQKDLTWDQQLLIYKLETDTWEMVNPAGYRYYTRTYVDYAGTRVSTNYTDFSTYDPNTDTVGDLGFMSLVGNYPDYPPQFPTPRGDLCMIGYTGTVVVNATLNRTSPRVVVMNGFRTYDSPYPNPDATENPYPTLPYYLDTKDIWQYDELSGTWTQMFVGKEVRGGGLSKGANTAPLPRRGGSAVLVNDTRDEYIALFGGYKGDDLYGDLWLMKNYKNDNFEQRKWLRIDDKIPTGMNGTIRPANVTYHSLNFDPITGRLFLFGGLNWTTTNISLSDSLVDVDRRCFLTARSIIKTVCPEAPNNAACALQQAKQSIVQLCDATNNGDSTSTTNSEAFCCESVSELPFINRLSDLAQLCITECQSNSFQYQLSLGFGEGMWVLDPNACENACNEHGNCKWGKCLCEPGWTGSDCSVPTCPGSFCYYDPNSFETVCNQCSGNGKCGLGGNCSCNDGWTGPDCGSILCTRNCTGWQFCLPDFPVNQCICDARRSGRSCEVQLCLNNCSMSGNCTANGTCSCMKNFYGDDCSVYVPTLSSGSVTTWFSLTLVLVITAITDKRI